jgi:hypothetical protein
VDGVIYLIIDLVRRVRDGHWKRRKIPVWHFLKRSSYSSKDDETGPQDFKTSSNWDLNFNMMQNISLESL